MVNKVLNIVLIFALIISVLGVTSCNALCTSMKKQKSHSCCAEKQVKDDCCAISKQTNSNEHKSIVNASVDVPGFLLVAIGFLFNIDFFSAVLEKKQSNYLYRSPLLTQDLSVLHRVFRI